MKFYVEFNNGCEDDNSLDGAFDTLDEAKQFVKDNCDAYYVIMDGNYEQVEDDGVKVFQGSGKAILTNEKEHNPWFNFKVADFCEVEDL